MQHTANYNLPQWEAGDRIKRADFNGAMSAIDAALAGAARIVTVTYTGDGATSRIISLGFTPRAVIVSTHISAFDLHVPTTGDVVHYGGIAIGSTYYLGGNEPAVKIVDGGFQVSRSDSDAVITGTSGHHKSRTNMADTAYSYLAIA